MAGERVGLRYAQALYDAAKNAGVVEAVEADLAVIDHQLQTNGDFRAFLLSPNRGRDEKISLLDKVFGDRVTALTSRALKLMLDKRREEAIPDLKNEYTELRRIADGTVNVSVTSAVELSAAEQKDLLTKLSSKLGRKIEADFNVDSSLVGGIRVAYDDFVIDGSVRGTFNRLRDALRQDTLKQA